MTTRGVPSARPKLFVRGHEEQELAQQLISLLVEETRSGICRCEATFSNWGARGASPGFLYFDRTKLDFGREFRVEVDERPIFDGHISALEAGFPAGAPPEITVLAEDRLQELRMTRRTRTFTDATDAEVMRRVAEEHGLTPEVEIPGPRHDVLAQLNESDLGFLQGRARATGCELSVQGRTLRARPIEPAASLPELARDRELRELTVIGDLAHQRSSVTVGGWDVAAKRSVAERATDAVVQGELRGGISGARVLGSVFGARHEFVAHTAAANVQEARVRAEAQMRALARAFVVARGVAEADGRLRAGIAVKLTGIGPLFSGAYTVVESRHVFDSQQGIRVEFVAESAAIAQEAS